MNIDKQFQSLTYFNFVALTYSEEIDPSFFFN